MKIKKRFQKLEAKKQQIQTELEKVVTTLDVNIPGVEPITDKCFTVNFSTIHEHNTILSPRFYNVQYQKQLLLDCLDRSIDVFNTAVQSVIATGKLDNSWNNTEKFHPAFVKELKRVYG